MGEHATMHPKPGDLLLDRYRIDATFGHGGMATTYRAHDLLWQVDVALKLLRADTPDLLNALRAEFDILRGCSHPNLVVVHDFAALATADDDGGARTCFYTCEPVEGVTLDRAARKASWEAWLAALVDVLEALQWLHSLGIRHGDVKASNVLVRDDGRAVLIDLGCARPIDAPPSTHISGTPAYLAPELLQGGPADGRADLYAFGKLLEELCHVTREAPRRVDLRVVERVVERLVRAEPDERPSSANEVVEALGAEPVARGRVLGRSGVLVGRDAEFALLQTAVGALFRGGQGPRAVWIRGPEGIGRSRLLRELKWTAQQLGRVVEVNASTPYAVYDALSRSNPHAEPVRSLDAVLNACDRLAETRADPAVVLVDDAHRLHGDQQQAWFAMHRSLDPAMPLLLVSTSTESAPDDVPVHVVDLLPLKERDLRIWVGDTLSDEALQRLHRVSGGYPASVRAVLDQLERGDLDDAALLDASVPLSERRLLAVSAMPAGARRALALLVVLGGILTPSDRARHGVPVDSLEALLDGGFVERDGASFKLVRSAEGARLLDAVGAEVTREAHARVARTLGAERSADLVYHLAAAHEAKEAASVLVSNQHRFETAPRTWLRAAQAVADVVDDPQIQVLLARLERLSGDVQRARERLGRLTEGMGTSSSASVRRETAACALTLGELDSAIAMLEGLLDEAGDTEERALTSYLLGRAITRKGGYRRTLDACERALAAASESLGLELRADLLETAAVASSFLGDTRTARARFGESLALVETLQDPRRLIRSHGSRALVEFHAGNLEQAARGYAAALQVAERHGLNDQVATAALNLGTLCHQRGDWATAMSSYERGMRMAVALGQRGTQVALRFNLAKLYADIGLFDRAHHAATKCEQEAGSQTLMAAAAVTVLGEIAAYRREFDLAHRKLSEARKTFAARERHRECAEIDLQRAEIAVEAHDVREAAACVDAAQAALEGLDARDVHLRLELGKARLGLAQGRPQDALPRAESACRGASEIGQRDLEAEAHLVLAALWETQGSALLSRKHAVRAQELWEEAAARLPEPMRPLFWRHPRRAALRRAMAPTMPTPGADPGSRREQKLELLVDINKRLNSSRDTEQILVRAMDAAVELTGAERGFVLLVRPSAKRTAPALHVAVARNLDREKVGRSHLKFSRAIAEQVVREGQPVVTANAQGDERFRGQRSVHAMHLQSVVCVPVQSPAGILGAIYLDNRFRQGRFDTEDVDLLSALSDQIALALENARLVDQLRTQNAELDKQRRKVEALAKGQAAEIDRLNEVVRTAQRTLERRYDYSTIVGRSPAMQAVFDVLDRVIETSLPVLIQGESGTGKELIARAVHYQGPHRGGPLVTLNCGAVPESLLESELFGHVKGAFTGADRDREGLVLRAKGGTLFLDELGELPLPMQVKLLRVLQEKEVRPLGSTKSIPVDFRLVSATNRRLADDVREGRFREDLYYRVSVIELTIPPLRDRVDDIPELARHLLERAGERTNRAPVALTRPALRKLMGFHWPGNVRQLENVLLRASVLAEGERMRADDVVLPDPAAPANAMTRDDFERREMDQIAGALEQHRWNVAHVARVLGIPRPTLYRKLKRYGLVRGRRRG